MKKESEAVLSVGGESFQPSEIHTKRISDPPTKVTEPEITERSGVVFQRKKSVTIDDVKNISFG